MNASTNLTYCANSTNCELETSIFRIFFVSWKAFDMLLIIVINSLTMIILCKHAKLETPSNIFIAWLTLSDLSFAASIPFNIIVVYLPSGMGWTISCIFKLYLSAVTSLSNCLALFVISIDRLIYIIYSLEYYTILTIRKALATVATLLLISLIFPLLCIMIGFQGKFSDERCIFPVCLTRAAVIIFSVPYFIFIPITVGCYIKIGQVAFKLKRSISALETGTVTHTNNGPDFKITKVMLTVLIVYVGCNCMLVGTVLSRVLLEGIHQEIMYDLAYGIWRINKWVNPIIYVWKSKRFRDHVKRFWKNTPFGTNTVLL